MHRIKSHKKSVCVLHLLFCPQRKLPEIHHTAMQKQLKTGMITQTGTKKHTTNCHCGIEKKIKRNYIFTQCKNQCIENAPGIPSKNPCPAVIEPEQKFLQSPEKYKLKEIYRNEKQC